MKHGIVRPNSGPRFEGKQILPIERAVNSLASAPVLRGPTSRIRLNLLPWLLFSVTAGCLISACSHAPEQISSVSPPVAELPSEFSASEVVGSYEPLEWWKAFDDPVLDQVIAAVLASNFDLAEAVARVDQARARERFAKSSAIPSLQTYGSRKRIRYSH